MKPVPAPWSGLPVLTSVEELRSFGVPTPVVRDKVLDRLEPLHQQWIAASRLLFVATAAADGRVDVSPKGDPAGALLVVDETTLVVPERAGNKRMDGFHNLLENPQVGLLLVIPGRSDTLRINGEARIVSDGPFFDDLVVKGHRPALALMVAIEEVFFHCPKAFMRSGTWQPETWDVDALPGYAEIAKALWANREPPDEVDRHYSQAEYRKGLYPN